MSQISEWFEKRTQFKKPDFWLGILITLAGIIWFYLQPHRLCKTFPWSCSDDGWDLDNVIRTQTEMIGRK